MNSSQWILCTLSRLLSHKLLFISSRSWRPPVRMPVVSSFHSCSTFLKNIYSKSTRLFGHKKSENNNRADIRLWRLRKANRRHSRYIGIYSHKNKKVSKTYAHSSIVILLTNDANLTACAMWIKPLILKG